MCDRQMCEKAPSALEASVLAMFGVFMSHQNKDGKLTRAEFLKVLKEEMPAFSKQASKKEEDELFQGVDLDNDGFVSFKEFAALICQFACCSYDILQEMFKAMEEQQS